MDDFGKQFQQYANEVNRTLDAFPLLAANEAENFFLDSFNRQAWIGITTQPWKKRKKETPKTAGKPILVGTTKLKRRTRIAQANWQGIRVINDMDYAEYHNEGFRGTEQVKAFTRKNKKGNIGKGKKKSASGVIFVKAHSRKMNTPQRQFMGNSPYLIIKIERGFLSKLNKL